MKITFTGANIPTEAHEHAFSVLDPYRERLQAVVEGGGYEESESFLNLPSDEGLRESVGALAREKGDSLTHVVVVGIGGSSLGTEAVYRALGARFTKLLFVETVDARALKGLEMFLEGLKSPENLLVCVVSKSGRTTETVANADILRGGLLRRFGKQADERIVVITDEGSPMSLVAEEKGLALLSIPKTVGGRYSVLSAVGLFPLSLAGFDIRALHDGARSMRDLCLTQRDNPAVHGAALLSHYMWEGYAVHDLFLFDPALETLGGWYRQLLAESIGKRENRRGEEVRAGITPTTSVGSRDLHSIGQLALGGPRNRVTTFVERSGVESDIAVPEDGLFSGGAEHLSLKPAETILRALAESAKVAYRDEGLPFASVTLEGVSEYEIGAFFMWKMIETACLGELVGVNAFDQPEVEAYKQAARRILQTGTNDNE